MKKWIILRLADGTYLAEDEEGQYGWTPEMKDAALLDRRDARRIKGMLAFRTTLIVSPNA